MNTENYVVRSSDYCKYQRTGSIAVDYLVREGYDLKGWIVFTRALTKIYTYLSNAVEDR